MPQLPPAGGIAELPQAVRLLLGIERLLLPQTSIDRTASTEVQEP